MVSWNLNTLRFGDDNYTPQPLIIMRFGEPGSLGIVMMILEKTPPPGVTCLRFLRFFRCLLHLTARQRCTQLRQRLGGGTRLRQVLVPEPERAARQAERWGLSYNPYHSHGTGIWVFLKIVGFPPKSSILIGFSIINHPFWGTTIF